MSERIQQAELNNPKVTVIIPVYNAEKYLRECLDSVVSQSLNEIEIICIDDGSIDKSNDILHEYQTNDTRFMIIEHCNKGAAIARNEGIMNASGEFVIFLDSDDYYPSEYVLEKLYSAAKKYGVKAAGGEFSEIGPTGSIRKGKDYSEVNLYGYYYEKEGVIEYKDYQFDYGYTRFLFDREMLICNNIFFPELIYFEDPPFFTKALSVASSFAVITIPVYVYRIGYKSEHWSESRSVDLYKGLMLNLAFAQEHDYHRLYELTIARIKEHQHVIGYHADTLRKIEELIKENEVLFDNKHWFNEISEMTTYYR